MKNDKNEQYESLLNELSIAGKIEPAMYWDLLIVKPSYELIETLRDILSNKVDTQTGLTFIARIIRQ